MTLETFFQKFDLLAEAPDAVAKLRELVLHFAVTGQLSEPLRSDAPVDDLLGALAKAKKRKHGVARAPADSGARIGKPLVVPDHWALVPLADIGEFSGGMTPSKSKSVFWDGDVNWFSSKDIKRDELAESELKITREALKSTGLKLYSHGCLVLVTRSGILKHTLPVSILRAEGTVNQDLKVLSPFIGGLERYLQIMLRGLNGFIIESLVKTGTTVQSLKFEEFAVQPFPLPPLAEQKRIVAKVDELMGWCDRLEAMQRERAERGAALSRAALARFAASPTPANLQLLFHESNPVAPADLRKTILTLAVQGRLVAQKHSDKPAPDPNLPEEAPQFADEIVTDMPRSWRWARIGSVAESRLGKMLDKEKNKGDEHPYLRNTNVHWFRFELGSIKTMRFEDAELDEYLVRSGDVLICEGGHGIARAAVWREQLPRVMFQKALHRVRPSPWLDGDYFTYCLRVYEHAGILQRFYTGAGIPHFTGKALAKIAIPLPPLAEQKRIVAKVDELMALVDELEAREAAARRTAESLLAALAAELPSAQTEPETNVIDLHSSPEFIRAQLAAEIVERQHAHKFFGQTKLQKVIYLAEYLFQLPEIDSRPRRFPRGPHDPDLIDQVQRVMREHEWFAVEPRLGGSGYHYRALNRAGAHRDFFTRLWPEKAPRIRALIDEMFTWDTERCERFATVYAAWNDLIIWGEKITNHAILREVLENWDPHKNEIPRHLWVDTLQWMREHGYIPTGFGHATKAKPQDELSFL